MSRDTTMIQIQRWQWTDMKESNDILIKRLQELSALIQRIRLSDFAKKLNAGERLELESVETRINATILDNPEARRSRATIQRQQEENSSMTLEEKRAQVQSHMGRVTYPANRKTNK